MRHGVNRIHFLQIIHYKGTGLYKFASPVSFVSIFMLQFCYELLQSSTYYTYMYNKSMVTVVQCLFLDVGTINKLLTYYAVVISDC